MDSGKINYPLIALGILLLAGGLILTLRGANLPRTAQIAAYVCIGVGCGHREVIEQVNGVGGVAIAAHPAWSLNTTEFLCSLDGVDIAEVYNTISDEPIGGARGNAETLLDIAAANGKMYNLVAGDDSHFYEGEQCVSCVMVQAAELTVPAILGALKQGRFYASQGPEFRNIEVVGNEVYVETSPVSRITFCSNKFWIPGRCMQGDCLTERQYTAQSGEDYVRIQITDQNGRKAWSNPILMNRE